MLRITMCAHGDELVMKLEGCLIGGWVGEADTCWREAVLSQRRPLRVDLSEVCHVDDAGRELMTRMFRGGARFTARGCVMPELLKDIAGAIALAGK